MINIEVIDSYSRADALADGVLVDVTTTAKEAGIRYPVALTRAVWERYVAWDRSDTERNGAIQDEAGRLWDVLWMFRIAARRGTRDTVHYPLMVVDREKGGAPIERILKAIVGPGDDLEPVITIMEPDED